ncbi:MAG: hypothetical protein HFI09_04965 [Bacilli bacterium]|nr:hypothetical protein [Bacilli bacterium]
MKKIVLIIIMGIFLFTSMTSASAMSISDVIYEGNSSFVLHRLDGETGVTVDGAYCSNPNFIKPFKLLGRIFSVVKIIIPIIIIAFGVVDFFKAIVASKDDEIKKASKSLMMRLIAGVCIFFLPAIIHFVFRLVDDWNDYESDYSKCSLCITDPGSC